MKNEYQPKYIELMKNFHNTGGKNDSLQAFCEYKDFLEECQDDSAKHTYNGIIKWPWNNFCSWKVIIVIEWKVIII